MSLILEALKKSEQQRRLGEAPSFGSPMIVSRRRRNLLPLFGALIIVALGVGGWLMRTPSTATPVATTPNPATTAAPPSTPVASAPTHPPRSAKPARDISALPQRTATLPREGAAAKETEARQPPATPVAVAPTPARTPGVPLPADARPGSVATLPPASPLVAGPRNPPAAPPVTTAPVQPAATSKKATPTTKPPEASAVGSAATPATARAPLAPALPSIWELPYSTRKDLPEVAMTMHVYATEPAQRFVVIDGERYVEGDEVADGVTLSEIRADGMVLDFKGQRFVYPRDGR